MIEWILVVWLISCGPDLEADRIRCELTPAFEVGSFRQLARCDASAATVKFERSDVEFIALCIERDK